MGKLRDEKLDLLSVRDINFRRRRITNASPSINDNDYVVRKELESLRGGIMLAIDTAGRSSLQLPGDIGFGAVIFNLALDDVDLEVDADIAPPRIWEKNTGIMEEWLTVAGVIPTGADLIYNITKNNVAHTTLTIPDGFTGIVSNTVIDTPNLAFKDIFRVNVVQVGNVNPGRKIFAIGRVRLG